MCSITDQEGTNLGVYLSQNHGSGLDKLPNLYPTTGGSGLHGFAHLRKRRYIYRTDVDAKIMDICTRSGILLVSPDLSFVLFCMFCIV